MVRRAGRAAAAAVRRPDRRGARAGAARRRGLRRHPRRRRRLGARPAGWSSCPGARAGAPRHVVLVGKGITFDTGGISIKPRDGMKLMRKDMGGAAAVVRGRRSARPRCACRCGSPRSPRSPRTCSSGSAYRPGDVIRHYGGLTSEVQQHRRRGPAGARRRARLRGRRLRPDVLVDLATLTGANAVALGKRTAALYSDDDALAADARRRRRRRRRAGVADAAGRRLPATTSRSDIADLVSVARSGGAGSVDGRALPARVHRRRCATAGRTSTCRRRRGPTRDDGRAGQGRHRLGRADAAALAGEPRASGGPR